MTHWTFRDELSQTPINLSRAVLQLARVIAYPQLDVRYYGVYAQKTVLWLDPFNGGEVLTHERCKQLVTHTTGHDGEFDPTWLQPIPSNDILIRTLNNLRKG